MNTTVTVLEASGVVCIRHVGEMTLPSMLAARREAGIKLAETGYIRLLIDVREIDQPPETLDIFEISTSHHMDLPDRVRMALLVKPLHQHDARFSENVANNRGYNMHTFIRLEDALHWLQQD